MKVTNPLTIVAIFSGASEVFATGALVALPIEIQHLFIYFVMIFPLVIVVVFFFILFFRPNVLYAPSDYRDEKNYMAANKLNSVITKIVDEAIDKTPELTDNIRWKFRSNIMELSKMKSTEVYGNLVIECLKNAPESGFTTTAVSDQVNLDFSETVNILSMLESRDMVKRNENVKTKIVTWTLKI